MLADCARFVKIFLMKNDDRAAPLLGGKNIVLGVCSSIAVYKAADIASGLRKLGADVRVVMTANAAKLISPRIFQTLSRNPVYCDMWESVADWRPEHISLAERASLLLVAPATANTIGNFAQGIAPDLLSCIYLATRAPLVIAPAMNGDMYEHPAVKQNLKTLAERGAKIVEPEYGELACGVMHKGKLASVDSIIDAASATLLGASRG